MANEKDKDIINLGDGDNHPEKSADNNKGTEGNTEALLKQLIEKVNRQDKELEKLKSKQPASNDTASIIKEVVYALRKQDELGGEHNPLKYFSPEEIDVDDVLDEPVIFYTNGYGRVITDDKRNGKPVKTPLGNVIFFMHQGTKKVNNGKTTELYSYSTYPSYSKKEVEWLRSHTFYNSLFFENSNTAINTNMEISSRIVKHIAKINALEVAQVISIYKQDPNREPTTDVSKMKLALANEAVLKEIAADKEAQNAYFNNVLDKERSFVQNDFGR